MQVDKSHKQHLYEIYCLQMQMAEGRGAGKEGERNVGTVQVNCIFCSPVAFSRSDCQH